MAMESLPRSFKMNRQVPRPQPPHQPAGRKSRSKSPPRTIKPLRPSSTLSSTHIAPAYQPSHPDNANRPLHMIMHRQRRAQHRRPLAHARPTRTPSPHLSPARPAGRRQIPGLEPPLRQAIHHQRRISLRIIILHAQQPPASPARRRPTTAPPTIGCASISIPPEHRRAAPVILARIAAAPSATKPPNTTAIVPLSRIPASRIQAPCKSPYRDRPRRR